MTPFRSPAPLGHKSRSWTGDVHIDSLAVGGDGIARLPDGRVAFVSRVIDGERVRATLERTSGKRQQLKLLEVLDASPDRVSPPCPIWQSCGGCDFMHLSPTAQVERHARIVREIIEHHCGVHPAVASHRLGDVAGLRARARFLLDRSKRTVGYRARQSHAMVSIEACGVLEAGLVDAARRIASWVFEGPRRRDKSSGSDEIAIAFGERAGARMPVAHVLLEADPPASFFARASEACTSTGEGALAGVLVSLRGAREPIAIGDPRAVQRGADGLPLVIEAGGFAQPSDAGAALLAERVSALAEVEGASVLELFSGSGTLSVELARGARSFASVEESSGAVRCARDNLARRSLQGALSVGDAEHARIPSALDVVVLDPPRAGAPQATQSIAAARPRRVVYVSCEPPTLGRDLGALVARGYDIDAVETVEIFPNTSHVETIVRLRRGLVIVPLDDRQMEEIARYRLAFTCERCAQFEPDGGTCSAGYPNGEHVSASVASRRLLVFCKEFELA